MPRTLVSKMRAFQHPKSHFERCKVLLESGETSNLFYAALEFRFCVEARLHEYAERADEFAKSRGNKWKVKDLAKHIDGVFGSDDRTYELRIKTRKNPEPRVIRYTPITPKVRTLSGRIDNFLHYQGVLQCQLNGADETLRKLLEQGLEEIAECLSGTMQGPILQNPDGTLSLQFELPENAELKDDFLDEGEFHLSINLEPFDLGD